jgi:hypothetical protein
MLPKSQGIARLRGQTTLVAAKNPACFQHTRIVYPWALPIKNKPPQEGIKQILSRIIFLGFLKILSGLKKYRL